METYLGELKGSILPIEIAWGDAEHESKINVNEMSQIGYQYISIVSILELKQIRNERITCQTFNEILLCDLKFISETIMEKVIHICKPYHLFLESINWQRIREKF